MWSRRNLFVLAGAGAVVWAVPRLIERAAPLPGAEPIKDLPGFERLDTGAVTAAPAMIGLERRSAVEEWRIAAIRRDPEAALFGQAQPGVAPVAVFTDVNCPNCRELSTEVIELGARPDVAVTWHELPLLGPTSDMGARAALAAGLQGGYEAVHARLMASRFRPSPGYLREIAVAAGLDADRMLADMTAPQVEAHLAQARALAHVLAIPGTPAMVIGHTLVVGALTPSGLRRLIARA